MFPELVPCLRTEQINSEADEERCTHKVSSRIHRYDYHYVPVKKSMFHELAEAELINNVNQAPEDRPSQK